MGLIILRCSIHRKSKNDDWIYQFIYFQNDGANILEAEIENQDLTEPSAPLEDSDSVQSFFGEANETIIPSPNHLIKCSKSQSNLDHIVIQKKMVEIKPRADLPTDILEILNGVQDVNYLNGKFPLQSNCIKVLKFKEVELNKTKEEILKLKNVSETEVDVKISIEDFDYEVILF